MTTERRAIPRRFLIPGTRRRFCSDGCARSVDRGFRKWVGRLRWAWFLLVLPFLSVGSAADTETTAHTVGPELWLAPLVWSRVELANDDGEGFLATDEEVVSVLSTLVLARNRIMAELDGDEPAQARNLVSVYVIDFALSSLCHRIADSFAAQAFCHLRSDDGIHFRDLADAVNDEVARLLSTDELHLGQHVEDLADTKAAEIGETLGWNHKAISDLQYKLSTDLWLMLLKLDMVRGLRFWGIYFGADSGYGIVADETCQAEAEAIKRALTQMSRRSYILYVDDRTVLEWGSVCRNPYWSWMDRTVLWHLHPIIFGDPCHGPDSTVEKAVRESAGRMMSSVSEDGEADETVASWLSTLWSNGAKADTQSITMVYDRSLEGAASKCPS